MWSELVHNLAPCEEEIEVLLLVQIQAGLLARRYKRAGGVVFHAVGTVGGTGKVDLADNIAFGAQAALHRLRTAS